MRHRHESSNTNGFRLVFDTLPLRHQSISIGSNQFQFYALSVALGKIKSGLRFQRVGQDEKKIKLLSVAVESAAVGTATFFATGYGIATVVEENGGRTWGENGLLIGLAAVVFSGLAAISGSRLAGKATQQACMTSQLLRNQSGTRSISARKK